MKRFREIHTALVIAYTGELGEPKDQLHEAVNR